MSDKELIKQEIERRFNDNMQASEQYTENSKSRALFTSAAKEDYDLLAFIDSLPEEPANKDLEEASINYADNEEYGDDVYYAIKATFKAGVEWQKQQMMKDAVDGEYWIGEIHLDTPIIQGYDDGDRIKFVPIKHEQQ